MRKHGAQAKKRKHLVARLLEDVKMLGREVERTAYWAELLESARAAR